jgi:ATP-dependent DNA helicase RecG
MADLGMAVWFRSSSGKPVFTRHWKTSSVDYKLKYLIYGHIEIGKEIGIVPLIFNDRIECSSPGRLPNTVTIEKLRSGVSYTSNPVLVKFMDNLRYMDRIGRGFPMIYREMQRLGHEAIVQELGEELRVTLPL